jgi:cysteine desulfurase
LVSVVTEHPSVLEPLEQLGRRGLDVTLLPVCPASDDFAGRIRLGQLAEAIRDDTILVSVMLANNEIGVIQPIREIGEICRQRGVLLHTDATQAVGRVPVDVDELRVDLMSFSAHKMYGPKGVGGLYVRRRAPHVKLEAIQLGGGQERGLRSGTLNVPGIAGFAKAVQLCVDELPAEQGRLRHLRDRLYRELSALPEVTLNGPALAPHLRLANNLNVAFVGVDGETLLMNARGVAASSGSACASAKPEPSHVLLNLGLSEEMARSSIRFGLGRFNTEEDVTRAAAAITVAVNQLRGLGPESSLCCGGNCPSTSAVQLGTAPTHCDPPDNRIRESRKSDTHTLPPA